MARKALRDRQAAGKAVMENALLQALKARGLYVIRNGENRGASQKAIGIFLRATIVVAVVSVVLHVRRVGLRPYLGTRTREWEDGDGTTRVPPSVSSRMIQVCE